MDLERIKNLQKQLSNLFGVSGFEDVGDGRSRDAGENPDEIWVASGRYSDRLSRKQPDDAGVAILSDIAAGEAHIPQEDYRGGAIGFGFEFLRLLFILRQDSARNRDARGGGR